jgi:hypothetical protein
MNEKREITTDDFFDIFVEHILTRDTFTTELMSIPGIWDILEEHYHDEIIEIWDYEYREIEEEES